MPIFFRPIFAAFLTLAFVLAALTGGPGSGPEPALMNWVAEKRADCPLLTQAAALLTRLGSAPFTLGIVAPAALWLLLRRAPGPALLLAMTVVSERLLVDGLKEWIGRPRPPLDPALVHSLAYPSGHSANSMTAFLATALIATPPAYRRTAAIAGFAVAIVVGLTRVLLGVHWPSDVIGGWALGLLAVIAAVAIGQRSGALRLEPQHEIVRRHGATIGEDEPA